MTSSDQIHIFRSPRIIIPLAEVQHIEIHSGQGQTLAGLSVVMKSTRWNFTHDNWDNNCWVGEQDQEAFLDAWERFQEWVKVNCLIGSAQQ